MLKHAATVLALALAAGTAAAQGTTPATPIAPAKPAAAAPAAAKSTLKIGDAAPALTVEKFLKGEPVTGFEKGRVYVVEFWATWCGPCRASMPHITKLQSQYKSQGLTVVSVNIWEDREYSDTTLPKVEKFMTEQGSVMGYTVAYDGKSRAMDTAYMKAAGRNGIPSCFVVNQDGKIAWIGHPMMLDAVLADVIGGRWDLEKSPAKLDADIKRASEIAARSRTDAKAALADWRAFEKDAPTLAASMDSAKLAVLQAAGEWNEAYKIMGAQVDEAITQHNAMTLNSIAWSIVDPDAKVANKDLALALRAATKAVEFTKGEDASILDTLARVYATQGDYAKAISTQESAVAKAPAAQKAQLQKALDEYKATKK